MKEERWGERCTRYVEGRRMIRRVSKSCNVSTGKCGCAHVLATSNYGELHSQRVRSLFFRLTASPEPKTPFTGRKIGRKRRLEERMKKE